MISRKFGKLTDIIKLPLVKNTLKLSSSSGLMMFLPLVITPILSRLYSPEDYGEWGVFSSVLYILTAFLFLSYENAIVKSNDNSEIPNLLALCFVISTIIIIMVVIVFLLGKALEIKFFIKYPSVYLLVILLIATSLHTICNNLGNREKIYGHMAISGIINGSMQASMRILLGIIPIFAYGLIVGNVFAQIISTLYLMRHLVSFFKLSYYKTVKFEKLKNIAIVYKKFPLYDAPARLIEFSIANLALIILTYYWSREEIGCYSMIIQFVLMPISVIGSAMANVYYREISESINDKKKLALSTSRAAKITFTISLLPLLFLTLGGDKLLVAFLGDKWVDVGKMSLCLVIFSVPVVLSEPLLPIFRSMDKQELRFKMNCLCLFLSMGGLIVASELSNNIYIALITYSCMYAAVRFLMYLNVLRLAQIKLSDVNGHFVMIILVCYIILGIRIYFESFI